LFDLGDKDGANWTNLYVEAVAFESTSNTYEEFAGIQAPANYSSGNSDTARYVLTLPATAPGGDRLIQTDSSGVLTFVSTSSSVAYKEDIKPLDMDTSRIFDLKAKNFKYKDGHQSLLNGSTFGYLAEDVQKVLPEIVISDKDGKPDALHYQLLSVLLLEEVKKLKTRLDNLEGE